MAKVCTTEGVIAPRSPVRVACDRSRQDDQAGGTRSRRHLDAGLVDPCCSPGKFVQRRLTVAGGTTTAAIVEQGAGRALTGEITSTSR